MPTYVYRCLDCEKQFEVQQSFSDAPLTACNCEKAAPVKKVFTPVGVTFKGSGFYKTDSRSGGRSSSSSSSGDSSSTSSSSSSSDSGSSGSSSSSDSASSSPASGSSGSSGGGSAAATSSAS